MIKIITKSLTLITRNTQQYGELKYTQKLEVQNSFPHVNTYRAIDLDGKLLDTTVKYDPKYLTKILNTMIRVDEMDQILLKVKAQGRISFYMSSFGEHACIVGSAAALDSEDLVYTQYREQGAHIWRGYTLESIINQCIGNSGDAAKGRQMPVHYGSKALNNVTVSSPLSIFDHK
jgi:2-oxoisovalerate dehydrogenase E1 component alpha subunit